MLIANSLKLNKSIQRFIIFIVFNLSFVKMVISYESNLKLEPYSFLFLLFIRQIIKTKFKAFNGENSNKAWIIIT